MSEYNWSRFTVRINVNAPAEKLYRSWASREGIEHWFLRQSNFAAPGGRLREAKELVQKDDTYLWRWFGYPDDVTETGIILEANGTDFFKFSFGEAGNCSVMIKSEEGETIVELLQDNIPTTEYGMHYWHLGCKNGWTFYLANLKSLMEGGTDLRNKNEKITRVINA